MTPKNSPSTTMMIHRASLVVACAMMMASAFPSSDGARCASVVVACALLSPPSPSRPPRHASCRPRRSRIDDDAARCRRRVRCDSSASSMTTTTTTTTVLRYRYLQDDADYDVVDVANDDDDDDERNGNDDGAGGDASSSSREGGGGTTRRRRSLRSVLDDERRTMRKTSSIIELHSIEEYRGHVLGELDNDVDDVVRVIRFSAPWCRTCRSTNVAWERMASKVHIASGGRVKFYSVSIDGGVSGSGGGGGGGRGEKEEEEEEGVTEEDGRNEPSSSPINALREMLGITRVPVGMVHHPSMGMFGRIIDLDRASLGILRRTLEGYVLDGRTGGLGLDGPKKCGGDGGRGGNDDGGGGGGGGIAP